MTDDLNVRSEAWRLILKRKSHESIIIHGGASRIVVVKACSNCGYQLSANRVECLTILTRFKCPSCGQSIENSNTNRCKVCYTLCADSDAYVGHIRAGCPFAGTAYPHGKLLRDENPVSVQTTPKKIPIPEKCAECCTMTCDVCGHNRVMHVDSQRTSVRCGLGFWGGSPRWNWVMGVEG